MLPSGKPVTERGASMRRQVVVKLTGLSCDQRLNTVSQRGRPSMRPDQTRGCRDQISVVPCLFTVRQQRDVFQPRTDTVPSIESTSIDCPTRYAVTVVNLLQRDPRGHHNVFHL